MAYRILICDKITEEGIKLLEQKGYEITKAWDQPKNALQQIIGGYDAVIVRSATKITANLIAAAKQLKVIGRAGEGTDNIDTQEATEKGITVVNTPHVSATSVAELTIAHLLALARNLVEGTVTLREGKWAKEELMGTEVNGKTLGVIGCGSIGKEVEKLAAALGMKTLGVDVCVGRGSVPLEQMLPNADFITIHVPLAPHTRHMLSTKQFNMMKNGVMLIDCSRGGVVDQEALYEALKAGKVKAAAVDVFEQEPPGNCKLLTLKNVYATPHIGAQTREAQSRASIQIAQKIIEVLEQTAS
ncbi:MAG: hydroxyacid dehydrogenase [Candidatus Bathyarchaeota archaeon]|nr:hydroxyacid dehydrogenase [Candidatus Bathyarchaeota archaeon]